SPQRCRADPTRRRSRPAARQDAKERHPAGLGLTERSSTFLAALSALQRRPGACRRRPLRSGLRTAGSRTIPSDYRHTFARFSLGLRERRMDADNCLIVRANQPRTKPRECVALGCPALIGYRYLRFSSTVG